MKAKKHVFGRMAAGVLAALALVAADSNCAQAERPQSFYSQLGPGWNLGNALDCYSSGFQSVHPGEHEILWGNPPAGRELFAALYAAGFRTVRIPVTWAPHMDEAGTVDALWMARVAEVVDDALACDLYVILNAHHDHWYAPFPQQIEQSEERLRALWQQISRQFSQYDERLLFESMNEPRLLGTGQEWGAGTPAARDCVNRLNRVFVDTVRDSGGRNGERYLLIPAYCAGASAEVLNDLQFPQDGRLAVSLHIYQPHFFTHGADPARSWNKNNPEDARILGGIFEDIHHCLTKKGIPAVITEYGVADSGNDGSREGWTDYLLELAAGDGIPCVWWDNGAGKHGDPQNTFALINRDTLEWYFPALVEIIVKGR